MTDLWNDRMIDIAMLVLGILLKTTLLAAVALVAARCCQRRAAVRHGILLSALVCSLLVPLLAVVCANTDTSIFAISMPSTAIRPRAATAALLSDQVPPDKVMRNVNPVVPRLADTEYEGTTNQAQEVPKPVAIATLSGSAAQVQGEAVGGERQSVAPVLGAAFVVAWLMGIGVSLLGMIRSAWKLQRIIRRARPSCSALLKKAMRDVCRSLQVESRTPISTSADVASPTVAGAIRPQIILPTRIMAELGEDELRSILLHEMAHVLRRDPLVVLLQQLTATLYWLNPLVHLLNRELTQAREELCDNSVLSCVRPADYGETLLRVSQLLPRQTALGGAVGIFDTVWKLEDRISSLLDERRLIVTRLNPLCALTIVVLVGAFSLALAGSRIAQAQVELQADAAATAQAEENGVSHSVREAVESLRRRWLSPAAEEDRLSLYLVELDTGRPTLVADEPRGELTYIGSPCWSPDGRRILFDATPSGKDWGKSRLKMIDTGTTPATAEDLGAGNCPSWSPDGRRIAFLLNPGAVPDRERGVWLMDADGSHLRHLGGFGRPKWSPDGKKLLLIGFGRPLPLSVMDIESGTERAVRLPDHKIWSIPTWAGDSNMLVAVVHSNSGAGIALLDIREPERAEVKQILWRRGDRLDVDPAFPVLSPDSGRCLFVGRETQGMALYSMFINKYDPPQRVEPAGYDKKIASLALSPDGRFALFCSDREVPSRRHHGQDSAESARPRGDVSLGKSLTNLKHLGLAMHNHHDQKGRFPAHANYSQDGKPLLSWRVQILPYLGEAELFSRFRLDEPWDSPHNRELISQMPAIFGPPSDPELAKHGKTTYLASLGEGLAFEGTQGARLRDFKDGTSNTILAVEAPAALATIWTKPDDLNLDSGDLARRLLGAGQPHLNVLLGDGSGLRLSLRDTDILRAMFTRDGGETVHR